MMTRPASPATSGHPDAQSAADFARAQDLPAVDRLLRTPTVTALVAAHGHTLVTTEARILLDGLRQQALAGALRAAAVHGDALPLALQARIEAVLAPRLRRVINLTGTVIHTNLGRALLADGALQHLLAQMAGPNNLEYDLASGGRGDRDVCPLTSAVGDSVG